MSDTRTATTPVTNPAKFKPPANACDCHAHVYGPYKDYPLDSRRNYAPIESTIADYMKKQQILGFDRGVLTQPSQYGTDNRCMIDGLKTTGGKVKGLVTVELDELTDANIANMSAAGIVGIRLNDRPAGPMLADLEEVGNRLKGSNWHVEIMPPGPLERLLEMRPLLAKLPVPVLFEQMGHPDVKQGVEGKLFQELLGMVRNGEVWIKLGHPYMAGGYPYDGSIPFARALAEANPKRCVFGIDWPHPSQQRTPPVDDDGFLLDLFTKWVPDPAMQKTVLVDSPADLYRF